MKKSWSRYWKSSKQPRKQRKWRANAPLHARHKLVSAHLSKELRKQYGRRALPLRKGDEVTVKRGKFTGKSGKVNKVDLGALKIFIDGIKQKKVSGQEIDFAIDPSNVTVTKLYLDDKERMKSIQKTQKKTQIAAPMKPVSAGKVQIAGGSKAAPVKIQTQIQTKSVAGSEKK